MTDVSGRGALGVWHGVVGAEQRAAEDWYNREHHAERVAIPGFRRARRYVNCGAGPRYFSRYDVDEAAVLASAAYLTALDNPSPWSQKIFPHYRRTVRGAFAVTARDGGAEGGYLLTLRFGDGTAAPERKLESVLASAVTPLTERLGILAVEVWHVDADVTTHRSREKELRGAGEPFPAYALLVDASRPELAAEALAEVLPTEAINAASIDTYQLVFQKFADRH